MVQIIMNDNILTGYQKYFNAHSNKTKHNYNDSTNNLQLQNIQRKNLKRQKTTTKLLGNKTSKPKQ